MHSGARGKHGSKRPLKASVQSWVRYKAKEVELLITKLAKDGKTASQIGIILRDSYGIPNVRQIVGKSLQQILVEKTLLAEIPDDLYSLMKKAVLARRHFKIHKHDFHTKRGITNTESKIRRLAKYYKNTGRLSVEWKYVPEEVKIFME